jgi:monoamine oxidase
MVMTKLNADVLVIGGDDAGLDVVVVEALEHIGGRSFTRPDSATPAPIELGAEFIYGRAPELTHVLHEASLSSVDVGGERWTTWTAAPTGRFLGAARSRHAATEGNDARRELRAVSPSTARRQTARSRTHARAPVRRSFTPLIRA